MPFGKGKSGLNLDCVSGNIPVTVVTKCGIVFTGKVKDDHHVRAVYGCPSCFPYDKDDKDKDDKCKKFDYGKDDDKKECCPPPHVDVEVKCEKDPNFICLKLTCPAGKICCLDGNANTATLVPIVVNRIGVLNPFLFDVDDTVLINADDICAIGPASVCPERPDNAGA